MLHARLFFSLICLSALSACSSTPVAKAPETRRSPPPAASRPAAASPAPVKLDNQKHVVSLLQAQHAEWAGTRHRLGGLSRQGVDCSGFVYVTLKDKFGYNPPRTTYAQSRWGDPVEARNLQPADLVFFRTGIKSRHVGIYMGNRQFLHASASKGVKVSSMDDHYWRNRFWQARRPPAVRAVALLSEPPSDALACR